jgi:glyoxylase-like metal-dependent hydrolase (beta-lactamase superfamily II)
MSVPLFSATDVAVIIAARRRRALLVTHPAGNVLWDCIPLLDEALIEMIRGVGGISAIAISHPHYYANMVEWSRAFDCPIYLHVADRQVPFSAVTFCK